MNAVQGGISAVIYPNNILQIEMMSSNGTRALIKPVYANWDFSAKTLKSNLRASGYNNKFLVNVSEFFTEKVVADGIFTVKLKSKCNIDVDTLNQNIYVLLGGYAEW